VDAGTPSRLWVWLGSVAALAIGPPLRLKRPNA